MAFLFLQEQVNFDEAQACTICFPAFDYHPSCIKNGANLNCQVFALLPGKWCIQTILKIWVLTFCFFCSKDGGVFPSKALGKALKFRTRVLQVEIVNLRLSLVSAPTSGVSHEIWQIFVPTVLGRHLCVPLMMANHGMWGSNTVLGPISEYFTESLNAKGCPSHYSSKLCYCYR